MKKYFFIAFKAFDGKKHIGGGSILVICSCNIERMVDVLLDHYNKSAAHKADKVIITSLTVLEKHTAAQLTNNFINGALIIDDGENTEKKKVCIERWVARDED